MTRNILKTVDLCLAHSSLLRGLLVVLSGVLFSLYLYSIYYAGEHWNHHSHLFLIVTQHLLLLPAVVFYLMVNRIDAPLHSSVRLPPFRAYLVLYLGTAAFFALWVKQRVASGDASAYQFQARTFSAGRLAADAPLLTSTDSERYQKDFRFHHHFIHEGKWFGKYPPGWPALLAIGELTGVGWLVNPLMGLGICWLTRRIALFLHDDYTSRASLLLLVASPYFTFNCTDFMSHASSSLFLAAAILFCFHARATGRVQKYALMALCLGSALLVRPFTAACAGTVLIFAALWPLRRHRRQLQTALACISVIFAAALVLLFLYNYSLTGSAWLTGHALYRTGGAPASMVPRDIRVNLDNIVSNITTITRWGLTLTVVYVFPFVVLLAGYGAWKERRSGTGTLILLSVFASLVVGHSIMVGPSGTTFGERFYFDAYFALTIVAARGWIMIGRLRIKPAAVSVATACLLIVVVCQLTLFASRARRQAMPYAKVREASLRLGEDRSLVFLQSGSGFTALDFNLNAVRWREADAFYVVDPGPERRSAIGCTLERDNWILLRYDGTTDQAVVERIPAGNRCN